MLRVTLAFRWLRTLSHAAFPSLMLRWLRLSADCPQTPDGYAALRLACLNLRL